MEHNHPFIIGEKVWDNNTLEWAFIRCLSQDGSFVVLKNDKGKLWEAYPEDVYQIAEGLRTAASGDIVCYEHNETRDGYTYFCPALNENFFGIELVNALNMELKDGTAVELCKSIQDMMLEVPDANNDIPIFAEDENGRLENITYAWYDRSRKMIRLTVGDVEFKDAEE